MAKSKLTSKYQNIPVSPALYAKVRMIAEANHRGLGDQVAAWVEAEMPDCGHIKKQVTVESYPNGSHLIHRLIKKGWYCSTCNRVYEFDPSVILEETVTLANKAVPA